MCEGGEDPSHRVGWNRDRRRRSGILSCRRMRRPGWDSEFLRSARARGRHQRVGILHEEKETERNVRLNRKNGEMKDKILLALDVSSREDAIRLVKELHDIVGMFKVGSQLFMAAGPALVREIVEMGGKVFLDLKFHDIPNTVTHAATEAAKLGVSMMTLHAAG